MIKFTERLDKGLRVVAWAHEQQKHHRKGSDLPYIIHPFGVLIIASSVTEDEDILIACLLHDVLEDVDSSIYNEKQMRLDFGDRVVSIVKDVTKDESFKDWHKRSNAYLSHLENEASYDAVLLCASDKIHNLMSMLTDFEVLGDELWNRFTTKSSADQLWWYESILAVFIKREVPNVLSDKLAELVKALKAIIVKN